MTEVALKPSMIHFWLSFPSRSVCPLRIPDDDTHAVLGGVQSFLLSPGGLAYPGATQLLHQPIQPIPQERIGEVLQQRQLQPVETIKAVAQCHPPVPDT